MSVRRITVNGRKVWQARVAYGRRRRSTIRDENGRALENKTEARQAETRLLRELKAAAGQPQDDDQAPAAPASLRAALERYAENMARRGRGEESVSRVEYTARSIEATFPEWLDQPVMAIGADQVFDFRSARQRAGRKPSTINRDLRTLRAMLKLAVPGYRFPSGAFFQEDETRVRWLRPEEELLVLETMPEPFRRIAKLAALTLMRMSEIRFLRRDQVHFEQGVLVLPRAKGGPRTVMLSAAARKILQHQLEGQSGELVFPRPNGRPYSREQIGKVFRRSARAAGLRDFHFHDLRHHGATMALNAGFKGEVVMELGGWKTHRMMRRYAAVTDSTLRAAAEAVSGAESPDSGNARWQRPANFVTNKASV